MNRMRIRRRILVSVTSWLPYFGMDLSSQCDVLGRWSLFLIENYSIGLIFLVWVTRKQLTIMHWHTLSNMFGWLGDFRYHLLPATKNPELCKCIKKECLLQSVHSIYRWPTPRKPNSIQTPSGSSGPGQSTLHRSSIWAPLSYSIMSQP